MKLLCVLSLLSLCSMTDTLEQAKAKYLDKPVVVKGPAFRTAVQDGTVYRGKGLYDFIPNKYLGQKATVIAVQETPEAAQRAAAAPKVNAMGEVVKPAAAEMQDFDIVVKFEDGLVAIERETLADASMHLL